jgi:biopolymer transport protein ExbD
MRIAPPNGNGSRIRTESGAGRRRLISLTPLIDVVFILLVFFMLSASAPQWESILLGPPVRAANTDKGPVALFVHLDADGSITLEQQAVAASALPGALDAALRTAPDRPVVLQTERGVPLRRIVDLLDSLSGLPTASISLMRSAEGGS